MYAAAAYSATNTIPDYRDRVTDDTSCDTFIIRRQTITSGTTATGPVGRVTVTISTRVQPDAEEILSRPRPPWHQAHAKYEPVCRDVVPSWKVKWRLTQQRPRDGLR